jgi:hypothetical protein
VKEFESIPRNDPLFDYGIIDGGTFLRIWRNDIPFKCIFGFTGTYKPKWLDYLNNICKNTPSSKEYLPDIVVVNRVCMIVKLRDGQDGRDFQYIDFRDNPNYSAPLAFIINKLFNLSTWQYHVTPQYHEYFNRGFE